MSGPSTPVSSLYAAQASPWLGHAFDASKVRVTETGKATYRLAGESGTLDLSIDGQALSLRLTRQPF